MGLSNQAHLFGYVELGCYIYNVIINNMNTQEIINALKEVDGETLEHIIREIGMEDQMLRQLVLKSDTHDVYVLLGEKMMLLNDIVQLERGN